MKVNALLLSLWFTAWTLPGSFFLKTNKKKPQPLTKSYNLNVSYNLNIIDTIALIFFEDADTEFVLTLLLLGLFRKTDCLFFKSVLTFPILLFQQSLV